MPRVAQFGVEGQASTHSIVGAHLLPERQQPIGTVATEIDPKPHELLRLSKFASLRSSPKRSSPSRLSSASTLAITSSRVSSAIFHT